MSSAPGSGSVDGVVRRTVTIANERGLHARAAAKFVTVAGGYDAEVAVRKDGATVSGLSIMGLMMLAAGPGCEIELVARGPQAGPAVDALTRLVAARFEEN
ncbi:MAG: HPr family phosphocarrier protein [Alphaproteobacteria bacterium]